MSVRTAVIGCGVMGTDHARILAEEIAGAELRAVCDTQIDRARKVAETFGAFECSSDPLAVISRSDIDAILIASLDIAHLPQTLAAIAAAKPVLCEKPLATTASHCQEIIDAEVNLGRKLVSVGFMRRFDPPYTELKSSLEAGQLGAALIMHNFHRNVEAPEYFTGQMAITNSATHEFDIARFVLKTEYRTVSAYQPQLDESGGKAPVLMVLETSGGHLVTIDVNTDAAYGYDVRCELVGRKGSMSSNATVHSRQYLDLGSREHFPVDWRPRFSEAYRLQNKDWINSINAGQPSAIAADAWDGYCATFVGAAGVKALANGQRTTVEQVAPPVLYRDRGSPQ